jgi:hypothetical protein
MDIAAIASYSTSIAETGIKQDIGVAVLKKALQADAATATALIEALPATPSVQNLPPNLGNTINTTA